MAWWIKNLWLFCSILLKFKKNKACKVWREILSMFACQHVNHLLKNQNCASRFKQTHNNFFRDSSKIIHTYLVLTNLICHRASFIFHRFCLSFLSLATLSRGPEACHTPRAWGNGPENPYGKVEALENLETNCHVVFGRNGDWISRPFQNRGGKSYVKTRL